MLYGLALQKITVVYMGLASNCDLNRQTFFFLPSWSEYLITRTDPLGKCQPYVQMPHDILLIALAFLDILLRVAGFVAVISIMVAGAQHLFSGGDPQKAASARKRLYNAVIGLAIAMTATAIVTFVGNQIGG